MVNKDFTHRHNTDGSVDSICMKCFRTVGSCQSETDLEVDEMVLDCCDAPEADPETLFLRTRQIFR